MDITIGIRPLKTGLASAKPPRQSEVEHPRFGATPAKISRKKVGIAGLFLSAGLLLTGLGLSATGAWYHIRGDQAQKESMAKTDALQKLGTQNFQPKAYVPTPFEQALKSTEDKYNRKALAGGLYDMGMGYGAKGLLYRAITGKQLTDPEKAKAFDLAAVYAMRNAMLTEENGDLALAEQVAVLTKNGAVAKDVQAAVGEIKKSQPEFYDALLVLMLEKTDKDHPPDKSLTGKALRWWSRPYTPAKAQTLVETDIRSQSNRLKQTDATAPKDQPVNQTKLTKEESQFKGYQDVLKETEAVYTDLVTTVIGKMYPNEPQRVKECLDAGKPLFDLAKQQQGQWIEQNDTGRAQLAQQQLQARTELMEAASKLHEKAQRYEANWHPLVNSGVPIFGAGLALLLLLAVTGKRQETPAE